MHLKPETVFIIWSPGLATPYPKGGISLAWGDTGRFGVVPVACNCNVCSVCVHRTDTVESTAARNTAQTKTMLMEAMFFPGTTTSRE